MFLKLFIPLIGLTLGHVLAVSPFSAIFKTKEKFGLKFRLDPNFNGVIINNQEFICDINNACEILEKEEKAATYNSTLYYYNEVLVTLLAEDSNEIQLKARLGSLKRNIFGIHPMAIWKVSGKKTFMNIDLVTGIINLLDEPSPNYATLEKSRVFDGFVINAQMDQKLQNSWLQTQSHQKIELLFPNEKEFYEDKYFLMTEYPNLAGWQNFLDTIISYANKNVRLSITLLKSKEIIFNKEIFRNFDHEPFKQLKEISETHTLFYMGHFFFQKSNMKLEITIDKNIEGIQAAIDIQDSQYILYFGIRFVTILRAVSIMMTIVTGLVIVFHFIPIKLGHSGLFYSSRSFV